MWKMHGAAATMEVETVAATNAGAGASFQAGWKELHCTFTYFLRWGLKERRS
jgi:hypothetical protein